MADIGDRIPYLFYKNAADLIVGYDGSTPFHLFLKEQFREHKNWGSKDRKRYRACCYYFWRNAYGVSRHNTTEILHYLQTHFPAPNHSNTPHPPTAPYTPFARLLSKGIPVDALTPWFQTEPWVWLRAVTGKEQQVLKKLEQQQIVILSKHNGTIAVSAQANLETITQQGIAYIQDIGSQQAMDWQNTPLKALCTPDHRIWDCCAGAGGKSITLLQNHAQAQVECADIRSNILENLQTRFQSLQLKAPKTRVCNLESEIPNQSYDIVVADVPCSGSGTWRRNPENLHFFTAPEIGIYANKQQRILNNLANAVKTGGYLVYLTCSVFQAENEDNIEKFLLNHPQYQTIKDAFCGGTAMGGDYIYRAILQKIEG